MAFNKDKINELYPGAVMYEAMKIHNSTDSQLLRACESGKYFGQLKKDGYWYQLEKHENATYLFSRTKSKKTGLQSEKSANVPHIVSAIADLPNDTILVGEIYYPGSSSKSVTEIMGCLPEKAIKRQQTTHSPIHYYIHDILMYDGVDLVANKVSNEIRYKILEKIFYLHSLDKFDYLELAEVWEDNLYERVGTALSAGEEGMVLKLKTGYYEPGKRPDSNIKAKKVDFIDAIIIGFEEPTPYYYGKEIATWQYWVDPETQEFYAPGFHYEKSIDENNPNKFKAVTKPFYMGWYNARINIGAYDDKGNIVNIGTIHSGISDEMKENMSKNPDSYLGKVCEIQCMELDKKEQTLRHGFLLKIREDKNPEDCTIDTIF